MEIEGLCRIEVCGDQHSLTDDLDMGNCYPGLLKIVKFNVINLTGEDLEIHVQSDRPDEVLFMGGSYLLDETYSIDMSLTKFLERMCDNNSALSSNFSFPTYHRPLLDLLGSKLITAPMERSKRVRAVSGDASTISKCESVCHGWLKEDCDDEERFFLHSAAKLSSVHPSIVSRNRKVQHKVGKTVGSSHVSEWRIQISARGSGHVYFVVCPCFSSDVNPATAVDSSSQCPPPLSTTNFTISLKWKLQCPSSNVYAFRRAMWSRHVVPDASAGRGLEHAPLSVSRSLVLPFQDTQSVISSSLVAGNSQKIEMTCSGRLHVSSITISPSTLNFGECNVGDFKSAVVTIVNVSDTNAVIVPYFESNTITLSANHMMIQPGQSRRVSIDYVVRVVDPAYSKTITFVNLLSPTTEVTLEIRAKNVDTCHMLLHDIFYKLYSYSASRQIIMYSKQCVFHRPNIRVFSIRNVFSEALEVKLSSDNAKEVSIYCMNNVIVESDGEVLKAFRSPRGCGSKTSSALKHALGAGGDEPQQVLFPRDDALVSRDLDTDSLVKCFTSMYKLSSDAARVMDYILVEDELSPTNVVNHFRDRDKSKSLSHSYSTSIATETNVEVEDRAVRQLDQCYDIFQKVLDAGSGLDSNCPILSPIFTENESSTVLLPVGHTQHFAVIIKPSCSDSVDELESVEYFNSVHLQLLSVDKRDVSDHFFKSEGSHNSDFEASFQETGDCAAPAALLNIRTIPIHAFVTRSELMVVQKNINFGKSVIGDPPARKSVVLVNRSALPLYFVVSKSRSIASDFMKLSPGGHRGIIEPKSSRTFHISFKPTLAGNFEEILVVRNVLNPENIESIVVKSVVLKPEKFILLPSTVVDSTIPAVEGIEVLENVSHTLVSGITDRVGRMSPTGQHNEVNLSNASAVVAIKDWVQTHEASAGDILPPVYLGELFVGEQSGAHISFKVRNVTHKRRDFIIDAGHSKAVSVLRSAQCPFEPVEDTLNTVCSVICNFKELTGNTIVHPVDVQNEYRDKLEKYKQDLKKAQRKNKSEKIVKIQNIIKKIEGILNGHKITALDDTGEADNDATESTELNCSKDNPLEKATSAVVRDSTVFHFRLEPEQEISLAIVLRLIPGRSYVPWKGFVLPFTGHLRVFENKNEDLIKTVSFCALVHAQGSVGVSDATNANPGDKDSYSMHSSIYPTAGRDIMSTAAVSETAARTSFNDRCYTVDDIKNENGFIAVVAHWCSCQTKRIFPRYRNFRRSMLAAACKLVQISASGANNKDGHSISKMHGLVSVTSMTPGIAVLSMWLENDEDIPAPEYRYLSSDKNGPIVVSALSSRGESRHVLRSGCSERSGCELLIREGETINFLIRWMPPSRDIVDMQFTTLLGMKLRSGYHDNDNSLEFGPPGVCRELAESNDLSNEFSLRVPIVCCLEHTTAIKVDKYLNLGNVPLGSTVCAESIVKNVSDNETLHYVTNLVDLNNNFADCGRISLIGGSTGVIGPGESKTLEISFGAIAIGKFDQEMLVTNMNEIFDQKRILVSATVTMPQSNFVLFPDIDKVVDTDRSRSAGMYFDLGLIQVTAPAAAEVHSYFGEENSRPFRINNISDKVLYVSAHSNLKKQCFIYADEFGTTPVVSMAINPGVTTTVYITLRNTMQNSEKLSISVQEHLREVVGGVRFVFYESAVVENVVDTGEAVSETEKECIPFSYKPTLIKLFETRPIRIRAQLGCSLLRLYSSTSSFRCVPSCCKGKNRVFRGSFRIENTSVHFRLRYKYSGSYFFCFDDPLSASRRSIDTAKCNGIFDKAVPPGDIKFLLLDSIENTVEAGSSELIEYVVLFSDVKGLYSKSISVLNAVTGDSHSLELNFFFDPQKIISSVSNSLLRGCLATPGCGAWSTDEMDIGCHATTGIKYTEGVFVTAVDCISCKRPLWVDKTAELLDSTKSVQSYRNIDGLRAPLNSDSNNSMYLPKHDTIESFSVLGCSDPNGFMCEWSVYNALSTSVRLTPISSLPLRVSANLLLTSQPGSDGGPGKSVNTARSTRDNSTSEAYPKYALGQLKSKPSAGNFIGDATTDRYVDSKKSIVTLPTILWHKDWKRCGDSFSLNPGESSTIRLYCEAGGILPDSVSSELNRRSDMGCVSKGEGVVAFVSAPQTLAPFFQDPEGSVSEDAFEDSEMLPIFAFARVKCDFVTPRIHVPTTNIAIENVRAGQTLTIDIEVVNNCDVEVPVAVKNLPEWMKLDSAHKCRSFGSAFDIPARASFKIVLIVPKVPTSKGGGGDEIILQHSIYVCNMCRAFSDYNYEKTLVSIELRVDPAVALSFANENGPLPDVKNTVGRSCLQLGALRVPGVATWRDSDAVDNSYLWDVPDARMLDKGSGVSCISFSALDHVFVFETNVQDIIGGSSTSTTLNVKNVLSQCINVEVEVALELEFVDVVELKMVFQGGLVSVHNFEMLPGENTEFAIIASFYSCDLPRMTFPLYPAKLLKQRSGRHFNLPGTNEASILNYTISSDESDSASDVDSNSDSSEDDSESDSEERSATVFLSKGKCVTIAGNYMAALGRIEVGSHEPPDDLQVRSVLVGRVIMKPQGSNSIYDGLQDVVTLDLICDMTLPVMQDVNSV